MTSLGGYLPRCPIQIPERVFNVGIRSNWAIPAQIEGKEFALNAEGKPIRYTLERFCRWGNLEHFEIISSEQVAKFVYSVNGTVTEGSQY